MFHASFRSARRGVELHHEVIHRLSRLAKIGEVDRIPIRRIQAAARKRIPKGGQHRTYPKFLLSRN